MEDIRAATVDAAMIIGGQGVESETGRRYRVVDPATLEVVGSAPLGTSTDARRAVRQAAEAAEGWLKTPACVRAELVGRGIDAVAAKSSELATLLTREQGKPIAESMAEITDFVGKMRAFVRLGSSRHGRGLPMLPSMRPESFGDVGRSGRGVTLGLVAWNFPVALMAKKAGPALMGAGTVVIKPAFTTPLTALRVVELMNAAGLPPGVLSCVTGHGEQIGAALAGEKAVTRVHLSGGDSTGEKVAAAFGASETELLLELAGSDPMIVCADADLPRAVEAAVEGRFRNAGQVCTAIKRLYLASEIYDDFVRKLVALVQLREPGDGLKGVAPPKVRIGPLHTASSCARLEEQLDQSLQQGAQLLVGGSRPSTATAGPGYFFEPTLVSHPSPGCRLEVEEVFGPVLPIFEISDLDDAVEKVMRNPRLLGVSIWTGDQDAARRLASELRCRQVWINRLPFGLAQWRNP